VHQPLLSRW